jgi:hypothetical protein
MSAQRRGSPRRGPRRILTQLGAGVVGDLDASSATKNGRTSGTCLGEQDDPGLDQRRDLA